MQTIFEAHALTKEYPGVVANDQVSLKIEYSSIHALLGENGAGKSTLVKMIYGLVNPTSGHMKFMGENFEPTDPKSARNLGIGMVFQHFSLFDALTVAENIEVGFETELSRKEIIERIKELSQSYGLPLDPRSVVGKLSAGERQRVEIVRCLLQNPKLLIMDEPTSVLTPSEVQQLFNTLEALRAQGVAILYISHKLEEIRTLCDHATILRHGKVVGNCNPRQQSARALAEMMVGDALIEPSQRSITKGEVVLNVNNISLSPQHNFGTKLKDINIELHKGEILGIAGVAGSGQDELLAVLTGEIKPDSGRLKFKGFNDISDMPARKRRQLGLICAPEERLGHAAVPSMTLLENAMLTGQDRGKLSYKNWLSWKKANDFAKNIVSKFDVRTSGTHVKASALSGGNLQKFVVGREISQSPEVFVVNQPTWGVDAAAAGFIRQAIRDLANSGAGVIVISQDLDELYELSDRISALCEGRLSPIFNIESVELNKLGELMGGHFA